MLKVDINSLDRRSDYSAFFKSVLNTPASEHHEFNSRLAYPFGLQHERRLNDVRLNDFNMSLSDSKLNNSMLNLTPD